MEYIKQEVGIGVRVARDIVQTIVDEQTCVGRIFVKIGFKIDINDIY